MVCFSAAVLTKGGKVLLARQFVEMPRMRIENHLATFPKLVGTEKQHNTVETAEVRYVYRPIESLLLVLVTNKHSNIVEDLETLRLFARVLSEYCPGELDEAAVCRNVFELTFAFDEIVALGHKENVTMHDIQINIEMESHEEKLANMIRQSKEREAVEEMKRKARTIARDNRAKGPSGTGGGMGGGMGGMGGGSSYMPTPDARDSPMASTVAATGADMSTSFSSSLNYSQPASYVKPVKKGSGMQLGKPKGGQSTNLLEAMVGEGEVIGAEVGMAAPMAPASRPGAPGSTAGIQLAIEEKLVVTLSRDGGLQGMEVKGDLQLLITDAAVGKCTLPLIMGDNAGFQFKTHPNINKALFTQRPSTLALRDPSRAFPTGSALGVLKWRLQSNDEANVPLVINCWPTQTSDDTFELTVEYELNEKFELREVRVCIPIAAGAPSGLQAAAGEATYDKRTSSLIWCIPIVDSSNASGTVEFTAQSTTGADGFFPIDVSFTSPKIFCELEVSEVKSADDQSPLPFGKQAGMSVESYQVV
eukprot:CAMPEP_0183351648 /NCGR_PEP_ID=MMETSP0164_2-20130417/26165_1 /TAXON_ID=221442 /ORGANISM="Coccolithus pelagicus ssp braarudi, Strain PLY182g" /LENGTH=532 /DNA_ID=CAMNT_0025523887 /DNA_START=17 /DNA_END=1615 /DNA_ORIENTATION=-